MNLALSQQYLESLACPACESHKLLLTKEKIIVCHQCLNGYKLIGDVPDFRLEHAISFKKKISDMKQGIRAVITVSIGAHVDQSTDIKLGQCVVIGRRIGGDFNSEETFVGKPGVTKSYTSLEGANQPLIEKYLSKNRKSSSSLADLQMNTQKLLGDYVRSPDFLLDDTSVSRSHAIVYQNENGLFLLDLVSKNGTYVNGYEVESSKLKHGDVMSIGNVSLRVSFL